MEAAAIVEMTVDVFQEVRGGDRRVLRIDHEIDIAELVSSRTMTSAGRGVCARPAANGAKACNTIVSAIRKTI